MNNTPITAKVQSGIMLLEALIAVLIFSLGILAVIALQAVAIKLTGDAKYRTDATLMANRDYMDGLMDISDQLGAWIEAAQASGALSPKLPAIAILYTFYARACDSVVEFLQMGGLFTDEQITELVLSTCFEGLNAR